MPAAIALGRAYGVFSGNIPLQSNDYLLESVQDGITANAGGGQTNAFQITTQTARITTVATVGDSIQLPPAVPGLEMLLINHGANAMQVYGNYGTGVDVIDDQAFGSGVSQMASSLVIYTCSLSGKWYTEGLSTGFSASLGLQTLKYAQVAASATDTQVGGTPIVALVNHVTSTGSSQACTLPLSTPGLEITIALATAANTVDIFPASGDAINALGANTKITMAALTSATFICAVAGQWFTVPRVPS